MGRSRGSPTRKLIAFDLDDTLVPSDRIYADTLASIGVAPEAYRAARAAVKARGPERHVAARNRLLYFKAMLESESKFSSRGLLELMEAYECALERAFADWWARLGRADLLGRLAADHDLAVVTNENTRTQMLKIRAIDPEARWFPIVITSEEMFVEKPAPTMFEALRQRAGRAATDIAVVGDDWEADLAPARTAGMRVVWTAEFRDTKAPPDDVPRVKRLDDLPRALERLWAGA